MSKLQYYIVLEFRKKMGKMYLEKPKRLEKLSKSEQEDLFVDLLNALVYTESLSDAALFLQDLLTRKEAQNLSKRLRIAKLLITGMTYEEIAKDIHVSNGTIAKIAIWLEERGDGFRKIIEKLPKREIEKEKTWMDISDWDKFKRRHALYFWPDLLLEKIISTANTKQKDQIRNVLDKLDEKNELHRRIEKLLHKDSSAT
ncbi:MAG: Trp family transcriptional regulator [Candidatus Levybacteria bacterium]|nr:Trp family transcriptional regulator [Candidatus Levybacteria bacterium]